MRSKLCLAGHQSSRGARQQLSAIVAAAVLLASTGAHGATLTASWADNSLGLARTKLERRLASDTVFHIIADVAAGVTTYVDRAVVAGEAYCYRAMAHTIDGESLYSDEACGVAVDRLGVQVNKAGDGTGTVRSVSAGLYCGPACPTAYFTGTTVTLAAAADPGSRFDGWIGGGCAGREPCAIAGNVPVAVTARFRAVSYRLTVLKSAGGTVQATPSGMRCGPRCSADVRGDTLVTLAAEPARGYRFAGWSGACRGRGVCAVSMTAPRMVRAIFVCRSLIDDLRAEYAMSRRELSGACRSVPGR